MKKLILLLLSVSIMIFQMTTVHASLPKIQGTWYDCQHQLVLNIDTNSINGCPITNVAWGRKSGIKTGNAVFTILEDTGPKDLRIFWRNPGDGHDALYLVDQDKSLHNDFFSYHESVNGVYLGMYREDVIAQIGNPDAVNNEEFGLTAMTYIKLGMKVYVFCGTVNSIVLYNSGTAQFDTTGLKCSDSLETFKSRYSLGYHGGNSIKYALGCNIGHGENINFSRYPAYISFRTAFEF